MCNLCVFLVGWEVKEMEKVCVVRVNVFEGSEVFLEERGGRGFICA